MDFLAMDMGRRIALVSVNPDAWIQEAGAWRADLRRHNQARLRGWRLVRVPEPWFASAQGEDLIRRLNHA
jgi:hypothetical protein